MKNAIKKKSAKFLFVIMILFSMQACDLYDLDINKDPNNPSSTSLNLLLASVESNAMDVFADDLNTQAMAWMNMVTGQNDWGLTNASWNSQWNYLYTSPLADLDGILKKTAEQRAAGTPNPHYEGIAKTLKAYLFTTMVDQWGGVPYFEAFKGNGDLTPAYDTDVAIYANCLTLLNEAIAHFDEISPVAVTGDLIYGGSAAKWKKAALSLKLRHLIQTSKVNATALTDIQAVITAGGYITAAADDFVFTFAKTSSPDNRHPMYRDGYAGGEAGYTYYAHQYMFEMLLKNDPRRPFYFKRQTKDVLDPLDATDRQTIPCSQRDDCLYGYFPTSPYVTNALYGVPPAGLTTTQREFLAGFFGRDRSDPSGIPADNSVRTTVGVYPAGGLYDDVPELGGGNKGSGNGIFPIVTSWMTKLYHIEAILSLGATGNARTLFEAAMREQIAKVSSLGVALDVQSVAITVGQTDTYVNARLAEYDGAGTNSLKLNVVLKEATFLNLGNGYEVYNAFRRTGLPSGIQEPLEHPRQFALRLPYAQDELNLNPNTPTIVFDDPTYALFWDVLKYQFPN